MAVVVEVVVVAVAVVAKKALSSLSSNSLALRSMPRPRLRAWPRPLQEQCDGFVVVVAVAMF